METPKSINDLTVGKFQWLLQPGYFTVAEMYLFGSRKSAKTKHVALRMIVRAMMDKDYNGLAMRKIGGNNLNESIMEELQWAINTLGVSNLWTFHKTNKEFTYAPFGSRIKLRGISINPSSGKPSLSGMSVSQGYIKDVWLEEAWEFTHSDYLMIRQTIRGGIYTMIITGNPYFQSIWCVKKAMEYFCPLLDVLKQEGDMWKYLPETRDDNDKINTRETIVHWSNFQINDKLSQADIDERWEEEKSNPKDFQVTGYGYPGSPSGTILGDLAEKINERDLQYMVDNVIEFSGGVDVGLENDATTGSLIGLTPHGELISVEGYYHSNGNQEANRNSNGGVWKKLTPHEFAMDILDYFMMWEDLWKPKHPTMFKVSVDNADSAFIAILNADVKSRGFTGIKFIPTKGVKEDKRRIEKRIIFERQMMSRGKISFLMIQDETGGITSYPTRLMYEIENIPYRQTLSTGVTIIERDGTKVHPDMTNAWEYSFRRFMDKCIKRV